MYYNKKELEQLFSIDSISEWITYAQRDIDRISEYIQEAENRLKYLNTLTYAYEVEINRHKYSSSPVSYHVSLNKYPEEMGKGCRISVPGTSKQFSGKERKQALQYAQELAAKYNCPMEGNIIN